MTERYGSTTTFSQQQMSKHDADQIMSHAAHILEPCYGFAFRHLNDYWRFCYLRFQQHGKTALPEEAPPKCTIQLILTFITDCKQRQMNLQRKTDTQDFGEIKVHILMCVCFYWTVNTCCNTTIHGTSAASYTNSMLSLCCWSHKYRHMVESKTGATMFFFYAGLSRHEQ